MTTQGRKTIRLSLKAGERLYVNGAVLRVDRRTSIELLNDVVFLLEHHVMQPEDATTPLRQLYFIVQKALIEPAAAFSARQEFYRRYIELLDAYDGEEDVLATLHHVRALVNTVEFLGNVAIWQGIYVLPLAILALSVGYIYYRMYKTMTEG